MRRIEADDLTEDIARLAEAQVAAGRFASVEEVVCAGVEAVAERAEEEADWLAYAGREAADAFAELDQGKGIKTTTAELMARLDQEVRGRAQKKQ